jgi:tRNA(Ile)-lysidine synthase
MKSMKNDSLEKTVLETIRAEKMLLAGDRVIAGVSGGADSVCLLLVLKDLAQELGISLRAVHVHHGLREAADGDLAYVQRLCRENSIPLTVERVQADRYAREQHLSTEEAGRILRMQAFGRERERWDAEDGAAGCRPCRIALAHHLEDSAETMLFNLCRGAALPGLRGIQPVSDGIVRPLIRIDRNAIESWLRGRKIIWRQDESNDSCEYTRNRIRHHVLPLLTEEVNAQAVQHIADAASEAAEAEAFLKEEERRAYDRCRTEGGEIMFSVRALAAEPVYLKKRVIYAALIACAGRKKDIGAAHVGAVLSLLDRAGNGSCTLPYGMQARKSYDCLTVLRTGTARADVPERPAVLFPQSEKAYECRILDNSAGMPEIPQKDYTKWFDYDKIASSFSFRTRKRGDRITVTDDGKTKTVARYMIDEKIPEDIRGRMVMPAAGDEILWIPGHRISAAYKVAGGTKRILQIRLLPEYGGEEQQTVRLEDKQMEDKIETLISEDKIDARIRTLGAQISKDYEGKSIHMIGILKGASFFMCELAKRITVPVSVDFMSVSSYGSGTESSGVVRIKKDLDEPLQGKDVIVVEDIVDSGRTLSYLGDLLKERGARTIRYCTLLDKPERRVTDLHVDYTGFEIPDKFVVGYGMDYDQKYRNLPYIGVVSL